MRLLYVIIFIIIFVPILIVACLILSFLYWDIGPLQYLYERIFYDFSVEKSYINLRQGDKYYVYKNPIDYLTYKKTYRIK